MKDKINLIKWESGNFLDFNGVIPAEQYKVLKYVLDCSISAGSKYDIRRIYGFIYQLLEKAYKAGSIGRAGEWNAGDKTGRTDIITQIIGEGFIPCIASDVDPSAIGKDKYKPIHFCHSGPDKIEEDTDFGLHDKGVEVDPTKEECKHICDSEEFNPTCHKCGKLMRDDQPTTLPDFNEEELICLLEDQILFVNQVNRKNHRTTLKK